MRLRGKGKGREGKGNGKRREGEGKRRGSGGEEEGRGKVESRPRYKPANQWRSSVTVQQWEEEYVASELPALPSYLRLELAHVFNLSFKDKNVFCERLKTLPFSIVVIYDSFYQ